MNYYADQPYLHNRPITPEFRAAYAKARALVFPQIHIDAEGTPSITPVFTEERQAWLAYCILSEPAESFDEVYASAVVEAQRASAARIARGEHRKPLPTPALSPSLSALASKVKISL